MVCPQTDWNWLQQCSCLVHFPRQRTNVEGYNNFSFPRSLGALNGRRGRVHSWPLSRVTNLSLWQMYIHLICSSIETSSSHLICARFTSEQHNVRPRLCVEHGLRTGMFWFACIHTGILCLLNCCSNMNVTQQSQQSASTPSQHAHISIKYYTSNACLSRGRIRLATVPRCTSIRVVASWLISLVSSGLCVCVCVPVPLHKLITMSWIGYAGPGPCCCGWGCTQASLTRSERNWSICSR